MELRKIGKKLGKKGAAEVFHIVVPILIFIVVCVIYFIIFWYLKNFMVAASLFSPTQHGVGDASGNLQYAYPSIAISNVMAGTVQHKTHPDYNISLYDIYYYGLQDEYADEIALYLDNMFTDNCDYNERTIFCRKYRVINPYPIYGLYSIDSLGTKKEIKARSQDPKLMYEFVKAGDNMFVQNSNVNLVVYHAFAKRDSVSQNKY